MRLPLISILSLISILVSPLLANELSDSHTSSSGRHGGKTVFSAISQDIGTVGFGFQQDFSKEKGLPFPASNHLHVTQLFLGYALFNNTQFFLNRRSIQINNKSEFEKGLSHAFSRSEIGTIYSRQLSKKVFLGIEPSYMVFNGNGIDSFQANSYGIRLLTSYVSTIAPKEHPLFIHANVQYLKDHSNVLSKRMSSLNAKQFFGLSDFDSIQYGLGAIADVGNVSPYVELTLKQLIDSDISFFNNPSRITSGFKWFLPFLTDMALDIGMGIGLKKTGKAGTPFTPEKTYFSGLTYSPKKSSHTSQKKMIRFTPNKTKDKKETSKQPTELKPYYLMPNNYPIRPLDPTQRVDEEIYKSKITIKKIHPLSKKKLASYPISTAIIKMISKKSEKKIKKIPPSLTTKKAAPVENKIAIKTTISKPKLRPVTTPKIDNIMTSVPRYNENRVFKSKQKKSYSEESKDKEFRRHFE